jgi:hypothetical protein
MKQNWLWFDVNVMFENFLCDKNLTVKYDKCVYLSLNIQYSSSLTSYHLCETHLLFVLN